MEVGASRAKRALRSRGSVRVVVGVVPSGRGLEVRVLLPTRGAPSVGVWGPLGKAGGEWCQFCGSRGVCLAKLGGSLGGVGGERESVRGGGGLLHLGEGP